MFELIGAMTLGHIFIIIIGIFILYIIGVYNGLVTSHKKVDRSRSLVDIYLKKRFDLIPNLVTCVKEYSKYEQETLMEITKLRQSYADNANEDDANKLNAHYQKLIAVAEAYPDIKAGTNYLQLQKELADVESEISAARRIFSVDITKYNTKVQTFPTNIFAKMLGYKEIEPLKFEVEDVKVQF